jgi:hypothetical protein
MQTSATRTRSAVIYTPLRCADAARMMGNVVPQTRVTNSNTSTLNLTDLFLEKPVTILQDAIRS